MENKLTEYLIQMQNGTGKNVIVRFKTEKQARKSFNFLSITEQMAILIERDLEAKTFVVLANAKDDPVDEATIWACLSHREELARAKYISNPINTMTNWEEAKSHAEKYPEQQNAKLVSAAWQYADEIIERENAQ